MPIIVEENQKGKLKRRQSYRSQRPDSEETGRDLDTLRKMRMARQGYTGEEIENSSGMKHGGMHKKKKMKKYSSGGMSKARGTGIAIKGTKFKGIF